MINDSDHKRHTFSFYSCFFLSSPDVTHLNPIQSNPPRYNIYVALNPQWVVGTTNGSESYCTYASDSEPYLDGPISIKLLVPFDLTSLTQVV